MVRDDYNEIIKTNNGANNMSDSKVIVHKHFEMGTAPYRYKGLWSAPSKAILEANPNVYNLAMNGRPACCHFSCDHCGTGINNHCIIADATGKLFAIGTDCLQKLNDVENLTQAKADQKKRQAAIRKVRADAKRAIERQEREDELQRQRDVNGNDMTDFDLQYHNKQVAANAAREVNSVDAEYFLTALDDANGDFASSIARQMRNDRRLPSNRAESITLEITAKFYSGARMNSKAYNAASDIAYDKFDSLVELWGAK